MDDKLLIDMGSKLVEAYYSGSFKAGILSLSSYLKHLEVNFDEFVFLDSLLKYAERPGSEKYDLVIPVIKALVDYFPKIKNGWRKTFEAFLVNRILGRGNVPEFRVNNLKEYFILRDDLIGILDVIPNETRIFAWVIHKASIFSQDIPQWVIDYSGFTDFQVSILREHKPGEILEEAYYSDDERKQLKKLGFRFTSEFIKPEDYIEILDFEW